MRVCVKLWLERSVDDLQFCYRSILVFADPGEAWQREEEGERTKTEIAGGGEKVTVAGGEEI